MQAIHHRPRRLVLGLSTNNVELFSSFNSPRRPRRYIATILPGVVIGSTTTATAALRTGSFPHRGCRVEIENFGSILGKEGTGGPGGAGPNTAGTPGGAGGDAIAINCPETAIINGGLIASGGGGGGGGEGGEDNGGGG